MNNEKAQWTSVYQTNQMAYPSEYVIRIFKGTFPNLDFDKSMYPSQKVLDIGCGDGRNLAMMRRCGLECYGVEITDEIVKACLSNLKQAGFDDVDVRTGMNSQLPFAWGGNYLITFSVGTVATT